MGGVSIAVQRARARREAETPAARPERRGIRLGAVTIERELVVGRSYVVDPPVSAGRVRFEGLRCVLLAEGVVEWDDSQLGDRVPVRFLDGSTAPVVWYFLRPE